MITPLRETNVVVGVSLQINVEQSQNRFCANLDLKEFWGKLQENLLFKSVKKSWLQKLCSRELATSLPSSDKRSETLIIFSMHFPIWNYGHSIFPLDSFHTTKVNNDCPCLQPHCLYVTHLSSENMCLCGLLWFCICSKLPTFSMGKYNLIPRKIIILTWQRMDKLK